jgi:uncharacterized glyoxalase superfamily protein PhnB
MMFRAAVPVLRVTSSARAEEFYCKQLGFTVESSYRIDDRKADPAYLVMVRDGVWLHVSSFSGDGVAGQCVYLAVDDVDAAYEEVSGRGARFEMAPVDQTWGTREAYVRDPDGNSIRFTMEKA